MNRTQGEPMEKINLGRRSILRATALAGGGMMLGLFSRNARAQAPAQGPGRGAPPAPGGGRGGFVRTPLSPANFVSISPDGIASIGSPNTEMGQGSFNLLPMMVAEELDIDWKNVKIVRTGVGPQFGGQFTAGSTATPSNWVPMRQIGGAVRSMLIAAAAQNWGVPAAECSTTPGRVVHTDSNRSAGYGELAAKAATMPVPDFSTLKFKDAKDYKIIGTTTLGGETKDIIRGKATFGIDITVPGMLYAVFEKTPVSRGKVVSANLDAVKAMKGVKHAFIVEGAPVNGNYPNYLFADPGLEAGVAIVAESWWAAQSARKKLQVKWDLGPWALQDSDQTAAKAEELSKQAPARTLRKDGDTDAVFQRTDVRVIQSAYRFPFIAHNTLEPQNATAHYRNGKVEVWSTSQLPQTGRQLVARTLGIPEADVTVHMVRAGGGFGRRCYNDTMAEAAWISKTVGAPVKLLWTREDDLQHDYYRPGGFQYLKAAIDQNGKLAAWHDHFISYGEGNTFISEGGFDAGQFPAGLIRDYQVQASVLPLVLKTGALRAPGSNCSAWVVQSFLDDVAHAAGKDPLALRLELLASAPPPAAPAPGPGGGPPGGGRQGMNPARMRAVLELVAEKSGWGKRQLPPRTALGIASHFSAGGYVAEVAEVTVSADKKIKVNRVWVAADVGSQIVNPGAAEHVVQGAVIDGMSELIQEITLKNGRVVQSNFHQHSVLDLPQAPQIDVHFLKSNNSPGGLGEPPLPPILPAVCNAIFKATGERIHTLPMTKQGYRFA
uniref:Aldehyde oxidase and xanthine dehydrogenase, molybdopterin binding n=1 Tax=Solibacter usitatus (strain Ellin6076) TaxID=234267 RepID=Q023F8_SOLUE